MYGELRAAADDAIHKRKDGRAIAVLDQLLREAPTIANAQFVLDRSRMVGGAKPHVAMRLAILRSFTVEPLLPLLKAAAALFGLDLELWVGGFNSYAQEMLDPGSDLYKFEPDVVLIAVQTRDLEPELWNGVADLDYSALTPSVRRVTDGFRDWIGAFRSRSSSHVVLQNLELPVMPLSGILDSQSANGQTELIREINRRLIDLASELPGVHVIDYEGLIARYGRRHWHDERKWLTARMPISSECLMPLAREYLRLLLPLAGLMAKVLVVDLDNTLWGGVVGEDGLEGVQVGPEYPGAAYHELQRAILALCSRGVLLAVASKNNEDDALKMLDAHPRMLMRSRDLAASRINWNDKAQSLREIAVELNVGLDSLVFLDDSRVERERIRAALPEVTVIETPEDPMLRAQALRDCPLFERISVSHEDRQRSRLYAEQGQRADLQHRAATLEGFLQSLEMKMEMREMQPDALGRLAQLTQKTNQFNLTTRRYSEQELVQLASTPGARVYQVRVCDRFGDNGLVGVAIIRAAEDTWEIENFLLSCRVIGRTIENAMLARIANDAAAIGARRLKGWFLATRKNEPASGFYPGNGFTLVQGGDGATLWELDLDVKHPPFPAWISSQS